MSPFEIFRRNLKPAMVVLTALSLFAFVVLPALDTYLRSGAANTSDVTVANFNGAPLKQSRIDYFTRNHNTTVRFLHKLAEETIKRGGVPRTPGFSYDSQSKTVRSVGILETPSALATVRTLQFAGEAEKAGFELDDTAVRSWLQQYTDGTMSDSEITGILARVSRNSMGDFHLMEQLRAQLLAGLYQRGAAAGILTQQQMPLTTPAQQWTNFLKLNRKATVDAYGLLVQDYFEQTNADPTASEIQAVYEEGKDRFPNRESPMPAFRRRETATFEYVVAEMQKFIDAEVAKLSEDEIRAEYEKRVKGGAFQLPKTSAADLLNEIENDEASESAKMDDKEKAADETKKADDVADAKDDKSTTAAATPPMKKADATPETVSKKPDATDSKPDEPKKDDSGSKDDKPEPKKLDADKKLAKPEFTPEQVKMNRKQVDDFQKEIDAVRKEAADSAEKPVAEQAKPDAKKPAAETKPAAEKPAEDNSKPTAEAEEAKPAEGDQSLLRSDSAVRLVIFQDDEKADSEKADSEAPSTAEPKSDKESEDKNTESGNATESKESADDEPEVQTFEDVRQQVAESMVSMQAANKLDAAIGKVRAAMKLYFNKNAIHESNVTAGFESKEPTRPDLKKMAEELGLTYEKIGPHNIVSLKDEPIADSVEMGKSLSQRGPPFTAMMYGVSNQQVQIPKQQLYFPLGTVDVRARKSYVSWKIDEAEAYSPDLDECKEEVIQAIRMSEARDLARSAADEMLEKIEQGEKLEDLIPEGKEFNFKKGLGPFSWMNSFGFGGAFLGNVPELDSVGEEFMGKVFSTEVGKAGAAANLPERVMYIVKPTEFQPSMEELQNQFKVPMNRQFALLLGTEDAGSIYQGFYEAMDERTGFNFDDPYADE